MVVRRGWRLERGLFGICGVRVAGTEVIQALRPVCQVCNLMARSASNPQLCWYGNADGSATLTVRTFSGDIIINKR